MSSYDFTKLAAERYSVRKFADRPIPKEALDAILAAGDLAPTAVNYQPQRILVIESAEAREKLKNCTRSHFNCAAALLVCYDKDEAWKRSFDGKCSGDIDASIVTTHMMLKAWELGIGSTWVMAFDPEAMKREFSVPDNLEMTALLPLGYPADDAEPSPRHAQRKGADAVVTRDSF